MVGVAKIAFKAIRPHWQILPDGEALILAPISRKPTPNARSGFRPCRVTPGRSYLLESTHGEQLVLDDGANDAVARQKTQLEEAAKARATVMDADARRVISTGLALPIRKVREFYVPG